MPTMEELAEEHGCRTPRHSGCRIPEAMACPPAPKKKPPYTTEGRGTHNKAKKDVYFKPPDDFELIFILASNKSQPTQSLASF